MIDLFKDLEQVELTSENNQTQAIFAYENEKHLVVDYYSDVNVKKSTTYTPDWGSFTDIEIEANVTVSEKAIFDNLGIESTLILDKKTCYRIEEIIEEMIENELTYSYYGKSN